MTETPVGAVRVLLEVRENVPALTVIRPFTMPRPFQLPPVAVSVPPITPVLPKLMLELPVMVTLPFTVPVAERLPGSAEIHEVPPAIASEVFTPRKPAVIFVGPV